MSRGLVTFGRHPGPRPLLDFIHSESLAFDFCFYLFLSSLDSLGHPLPPELPDDIYDQILLHSLPLTRALFCFTQQRNFKKYYKQYGISTLKLLGLIADQGSLPLFQEVLDSAYPLLLRFESTSLLKRACGADSNTTLLEYLLKREDCTDEDKATLYLEAGRARAFNCFNCLNANLPGLEEPLVTHLRTKFAEGYLHTSARDSPVPLESIENLLSSLFGDRLPPRHRDLIRCGFESGREDVARWTWKQLNENASPSILRIDALQVTSAPYLAFLCGLQVSPTWRWLVAAIDQGDIDSVRFLLTRCQFPMFSDWRAMSNLSSSNQLECFTLTCDRLAKTGLTWLINAAHYAQKTEFLVQLERLGHHDAIRGAIQSGQLLIEATLEWLLNRPEYFILPKHLLLAGIVARNRRAIDKALLGGADPLEVSEPVLEPLPGSALTFLALQRDLTWATHLVPTIYSLLLRGNHVDSFRQLLLRGPPPPPNLLDLFEPPSPASLPLIRVLASSGAPYFNSNHWSRHAFKDKCRRTIWWTDPIYRTLGEEALGLLKGEET